jgi:hypothetical protein
MSYCLHDIHLAVKVLDIATSLRDFLDFPEQRLDNGDELHQLFHGFIKINTTKEIVRTGLPVINTTLFDLDPALQVDTTPPLIC